MQRTRSRNPVYFKLSHNRRSTEMIEDYVEAIQEIIREKKEAKNVDLSKYFGVSNATVNKNIKRLIKEKLATSEKYRSIYLTKKGMDLADKSNARHEILYKFLIKLGVSKKTAEEDSEGMEHHISEETLKLMKSFIASS
jgi:DtxR family manganese transport transcriptional regulator